MVPSSAGLAICAVRDEACSRMIAPEVWIDCAAFGRDCSDCYAASGQPCLARTEDCENGTLCPPEGVCP